MGDLDEPLNPRFRLPMEWFDQLEAVLKKEAELAGLLQHGTSVGNGREFFVRRVLRSILPPMVHIGSGMVIGNEGARSKQVDIILYDPRAPMMEITDGSGFYFIEGVIATIEVKSRLTTDKLRDALENCYSVMNLDWHYASPAHLDRLGHSFLAKKLSPEDATEATWARVQPPTFIFSFTTDLSTEGVCSVVTDWYGERGESRSPYNPGLPKVIATEGTICLQSDSWFQIDSAEAGEAARREVNKDARSVMGVWSSKRQFGWLALRLMHDTSDRLGLIHHGAQVALTTDGYIPAGDYFQEDIKGTKGYFIFWSGNAAQKDGTSPDKKTATP